MIGRKKEIEKIERLLASERAEFLAITGRRRVGKTYLMDTMLRDRYCFSLTGIQNGNMATQLVNFGVKLAEYDGTNSPQKPENWQAAFLQLKAYLKTLPKNRKHVIFLDELPWIETPKSGFVQILAHFWNDYLSKEPNFILAICGSATSWIVKKVLNDPGGLHNRITENIHLLPFTLAETRDFLTEKGIAFGPQDLAKVYMALGGIPFYLENLRKGESFSTAIERICFAPTGILHNEYNNLYQALFNNSDMHQKIVAALSKHHHGIQHAEIIKAIGMAQPTGSYQRAMEELIITGFVEENMAWGKLKRGSTYRLIDEFSIFYHRFMQGRNKYSAGIWQQLAESQAYKVWAGYAFENLCHKHIDAIKGALGIAAVYTEVSSMRVPAADGVPGFQIDLLIDRKDNCINLCEIKFHSGPFTITPTYCQELIAKRQRFVDYTGTQKQVFLTFITTHGITPNAYAQEVVDAEIRLEQLLK
ncbi:MAG: AAA family ATPase [Saprospiraceae bacterium]|nr:AAA family ATPase [Saprospiraceae bacterium]